MLRLFVPLSVVVAAFGCSGESSDTDHASGGGHSGGSNATGGSSSGGVSANGGSSTSGGGSGGSGGIGGSGASGGSAGSGGAAGAEGCLPVTTADVEIGSATEAGEYLFRFDATSASHTSWAEAGNEALILEVKVGGVFRSHVVLHHGADGGTYRVLLGALSAGEAVSLRVSTLSAAKATPSACVSAISLEPALTLPAAEGILHAPILKWPNKKRFDDLPVVLGWSKQKQGYQLLFTNENGGTTAQCGGGADGVRAEIARWGRAFDIEGSYRYGTTESWGRCTGTTDTTAHPVLKQAAHPIFYYGDGHNRLFESRAGYGQACGTGGPEKADGDIDGFDVNNPGNDPSFDDGLVVTIRLAPDSLDDLGYAAFAGRREALADKLAPWVYRLLGSELSREGKIDQQKSFGMQQYLYADVYAADVDGSGDSYCSFLGVSSGFVLRAKTTSATFDSGQMTADYFGGASAVKRMAVPLGQTIAGSQFQSLVFDASDNDGIYWLALGDVFIPRPQGDNGATIETIHATKTDIDVYVDDDQSGCTNGTNPSGPTGVVPCVGGDYTFKL